MPGGELSQVLLISGFDGQDNVTGLAVELVYMLLSKHISDNKDVCSQDYWNVEFLPFSFICCLARSDTLTGGGKSTALNISNLKMDKTKNLLNEGFSQKIFHLKKR